MDKIIFITGGTGGHIYPALSVANKMKEKGADILFIGSKHRMEKELVPKEGFRFIGIDVLPLKSIKSIFKMTKSIIQSIKILKKEKPSMVIGFGNYITIPVLIAAYLLKIPYYLQEQNCIMGKANKYFYRKAKKVFLAFESTLDDIPEKYKEKFIVTGNPLREEFYNIDNDKIKKKLGVTVNQKILLVLGGSLGSQNINNELLNFIKKNNDIYKNIKIFWSTGQAHYKDIKNRLLSYPFIEVQPYFDNIPELMSIADLVMCRAGASTISELIQLEKPSVLIPYDYVGQKENADVLEFVNATKTYPDSNVSDAIKEAFTLIHQNEILDFMKENLKKLKKGNVSEKIVKEMLN